MEAISVESEIRPTKNSLENEVGDTENFVVEIEVDGTKNFVLEG